MGFTRVLPTPPIVLDKVDSKLKYFSLQSGLFIMAVQIGIVMTFHNVHEVL